MKKTIEQMQIFENDSPPLPSENKVQPTQFFTENKTILKPLIDEQKQEAATIKSKKKSSISLDSWLKLDGPTLLQESMKRLKLDQTQIHKASVESLSLQELEEKKKLVKNELKRYDFSFENLFNRSPIRHEKEPMRPLYIYYKLIKQYLTKETEKSNNNMNNSSSNSNSNNVNNNEKNYKKSKSFEIQNETNKIERPIKVSMAELKKRLEDLKKTKNDLRNKLHNYQQSFTKDNNRKIKYHKDIAPVEEDYKRYKDLKLEIIKLEEIINSSGSKGDK